MKTYHADDSCPTTGKVAYLSKNEALANRIGRKRAYICAECGCWHLTSQPEKKRKR
jgi:hypothetical protein